MNGTNSGLLSLLLMVLLSFLEGSLQAQDQEDLQQRVGELSEIPAREILKAAQEREGDFQARLESNGPEEILVYTTTPPVTRQPIGKLVLNISSFAPLSRVRVNQELVLMDAGTFDTALEFAYTLAPGENLFNARIESESGELQKTFTIFLETDEVKYQDPAKARKSSFSFITIGGIVRDDNINSASSDPKAAAKSSLTLVVVKQIATGYTSAVVLTGIVNADDQWSSEYRSREILFRQFSADWNDSAFDWGDLTVGLGLNEVGLSDPSRASSLRDSWNGSYKQGGSESFAGLQLKVPFEEELQWTSSLRLGIKTNPGVAEKDQTNKLGQKLDFQFVGQKWNWAGEYLTTNTPLDSTDSRTFSTTLKASMPIKPLKFGFQLGYSDTQNKAEDAAGIRKKNSKASGIFSVSYPLKSTMILDFSHKYEIQQTNVSGSDYRKNLDTLNLTLLF